jgi:hypothetical protein
MIDVGVCIVRTTESDREWREEEAYEDQEGDIIQVMQPGSVSAVEGATSTKRRLTKNGWGMISWTSAGQGFKTTGEYLQA